jgi:hypothetical protein
VSKDRAAPRTQQTRCAMGGRKKLDVVRPSSRGVPVARAMWCVKWCSRAGVGRPGVEVWCALPKGSRPDPNAAKDATACGFTVILRSGSEVRRPTCPECLEALARAGAGVITNEVPDARSERHLPPGGVVTRGPKIATREARYAAVMKYDERIRATGSSEKAGTTGAPLARAGAR